MPVRSQEASPSRDQQQDEWRRERPGSSAPEVAQMSQEVRDLDRKQVSPECQSAVSVQ